MKSSDKLKKIVFDRLYSELSPMETIEYKESILFINRDKLLWYFDFDNHGSLSWNFDYFNHFFEIFTLSRKDFELILSSWFEKVSGRNVIKSKHSHTISPLKLMKMINVPTN